MKICQGPTHKPKPMTAPILYENRDTTGALAQTDILKPRFANRRNSEGKMRVAPSPPRSVVVELPKSPTPEPVESSYDNPSGIVQNYASDFDDMTTFSNANDQSHQPPEIIEAPTEERTPCQICKRKFNPDALVCFQTWKCH